MRRTVGSEAARGSYATSRGVDYGVFFVRRGREPLLWLEGVHLAMNGEGSRKLRVQYPGAIYHLLSRGDRREDIHR